LNCVYFCLQEINCALEIYNFIYTA
jgi:hypothetical protein